MAQIPHERTKYGRAILALKRDVDKWVAETRGKVPEEKTWVGEWLACCLYAAAHNEGEVGERELVEAKKIALHMEQFGLRLDFDAATRGGRG